MGQPAARIGDMTAHGGVITLGEPSVLIGGMPAARIGDMHTCPMFDGPKPHVGGPITLGSFTVLIGKKPAARVGDMATCVGPPDTIAMGCFTVLIGEGGGGGGGAGAGSGQKGSGNAGATSGSGVGGAAGTGGSTGQGESHYLNVKFVDKGGYPITDIGYNVKKSGADVADGVLVGDVKMSGIDPGTYDIELKAIKLAKWSTNKATVGDKLKLTAEVFGIQAGADAVFRIFQVGSQKGDRLLEAIQNVKVSDDKAEAQWTFNYSDEDRPELGHEGSKEYAYPRFYFVVSIEGITARSDVLSLSDELHITLKDDKGSPIPDESYTVYFLNGEVRQGKLDANGTAIERNIPPAKSRVVFANVVGAKKLPT